MRTPWQYRYKDHEASVHSYTLVKTFCAHRYRLFNKTSNLFSQVTDFYVAGFCVYQELEEI